MKEDLESKVKEIENKMTTDGDEQMILHERCRSELEAIYDHYHTRYYPPWHEKGENLTSLLSFLSCD